MAKPKRTRAKRIRSEGSDVTIPGDRGLSPERRELTELKIALGAAVRAKREAQRLTQLQMAGQLATSQPRVARLERGAASLDLLMRALFVLGERSQAGRIIAGAETAP